VADGHWVNVGGWWVEPDCNLPTGESFVRQGLYGQRFLLEKFGTPATTGLNADPFGHNATLPQILRQQGIDAYCFLRPGPHEMELPGNPFWWESPDGSRVLACRIPHRYESSAGDLAEHLDHALATLAPELPAAMVFYGVGDHGGGPTKANIASVRELDQDGSHGSLVFSSPPQYVRAVLDAATQIPVWRGDLQHHAAGCYAANSQMKRWMREAEHALLVAEKWAAVANQVSTVRYPAEDLERAWKQVLFNQFHDILPGSAIETSYEDARDELGAARATARRIWTLAQQSIARDIDIPFREDSQPVLVFNPHPWPVRSDVECESWRFRGSVQVTDAAGNPRPSQPIQPHATGAGQRRLVFPADVPALGYQLFWVDPAESAGADPVDPAGFVLENDHLRVVVDPATGWLENLLDKANGVDLVAGAGRPHTVVSPDHTDTWGHRVVSYVADGETFRCRSVRLIEHEYGRSTLCEEFVLGRDARQLRVNVTIDWHEQLTLLKLRFPTGLEQPVATYEIPYGHLERGTDGAEEPGQAWIDVTGTLNGRPAGLAIVNNAKSAYDVTGGDIGITAVRSPVYAWHDPQTLDPDTRYDYQDQGRQTFSYLLIPHSGQWRTAGVVQAAAELAQPPTVSYESFHSGRLPASTSFASMSSESVVVTVLKQSEDDPACLVVRAYESAGRSARLALDLAFLHRTVEVEFAPHEIKTLLVPVDPDQPVQETDLLEQAVRTG
jgi:alpha-mannosidase